MLYLNGDADTKPERIRVENLPGGAKTIRLADHVEEYTQEEAPDRVMYHYAEVVFDVTADVEIDAEKIEEAFEEWWEYGAKWNGEPGGKPEADPDPTPGSGAMTIAQLTEAVKAIQEQNAMLEECLLEMSETVYA